MLTRRQFVKTGLLGSALLAAAYAMRRPLDRFGKHALVESFPLESTLRLVVTAVAPVILAGVLPQDDAARSDAIRRATDAVAIAVSKLGASAQREVAELFALLALPATRLAVAGVESAWPDAGEGEVRGFLDAWRRSRLELLKSGYLALHDLVLGAWYADDASWAAIGYPGPPMLPR